MQAEQIRDWLCGPVVAVPTPFTEDKELKRSLLTSPESLAASQ